MKNETMPSEIVFPMTLTSGDFSTKNPAMDNKRILIAAVIHLADPVEKRQLKTSQDNTKL